MKQIDRFQALIRHPDYRNDPRRADKLKFDPWHGGLPRLIRRDLTSSEARDWCLSKQPLRRAYNRSNWRQARPSLEGVNERRRSMQRFHLA